MAGWTEAAWCWGPRASRQQEWELGRGGKGGSQWYIQMLTDPEAGEGARKPRDPGGGGCVPKTQRARCAKAVAASGTLGRNVGSEDRPTAEGGSLQLGRGQRGHCGLGVPMAMQRDGLARPGGLSMGTLPSHGHSIAPRRGVGTSARDGVIWPVGRWLLG